PDAVRGAGDDGVARFHSACSLRLPPTLSEHKIILLQDNLNGETANAQTGSGRAADRAGGPAAVRGAAGGAGPGHRAAGPARTIPPDLGSAEHTRGVRAADPDRAGH